MQPEPTDRSQRIRFRNRYAYRRKLNLRDFADTSPATDGIDSILRHIDMLLVQNARIISIVASIALRIQVVDIHTGVITGGYICAKVASAAQPQESCNDAPELYISTASIARTTGVSNFIYRRNYVLASGVVVRGVSGDKMRVDHGTEYRGRWPASST